MARATLVLKDPQKNLPRKDQKETLIYLIFRYGNKRLKLSTGKKILPAYWNDDKQKVRATSEFKQHDTYNAILKEQQNIIESIHDKLILNKKIPTNDKLKEGFEEEYKGKLKKQYTLNEFIERYIMDMEQGIIKTEKGENYKNGTIKNFRGFQEQFKLFQEKKRRNLTFEDITIDFYNDFNKFFTDKNYSLNTIGRHIKNLKNIMRLALERGYHYNVEFTRKSFKAHTTETDSIYLNEQELTVLYNLDLNKKPHWDLARDIFLVGCYTAQRFSDYSQIGKKNIIKLPNSKKAISLTQQKTGNKVVIPIRPELAAILKKYKGELPKIWEQKLNLYIKDIGAEAGIKQKVRIESIKGGLKVSSTQLKCDLIKTHTARRSGCTNMYLAGIPTLDIMKISGHKTEKEFLKYIKMNEKETAQNLSNHAYFNKTKMEVV